MRNHGLPFSLDADTMSSRIYEFTYQKLTAFSGNVLGRSLIFVIQPDRNKTMNLTSDSYFSIKKVRIITNK